MVAIFDGFDVHNPRCISDWVRNFRMKKIQMKRKLRGAGSDLRINAILSTALLSAEQELRRKQQERFNRWLDMEEKFASNFSRRPVPNYDHGYYRMLDEEKELAEYNKQREIERNLWKSELSGLDDFMRSLSNSCNHERAITVNS